MQLYITQDLNTWVPDSFLTHFSTTVCWDFHSWKLQGTSEVSHLSAYDHDTFVKLSQPFLLCQQAHWHRKAMEGYMDLFKQE